MGKFAKGNGKSNNTNTEYGKIESLDVQRVKNTNRGCYFTLVLNGVSINGCTIRETKDEVPFISLPQYKGRDGNWYNVVYFRFSKEDQDAIINFVSAALEDEAK